VRRIRTVALVLRVLTFLLSILQTGALVLLATALFLIIIPVGSALMLGILLTALIESRHTNRRLRSTLSNRRACVLFLAANTQNGFLWQNALDLSARGYTVFLISPYWISGQSPVSKKYYVTARTLSPNVYLIRRYYFFSLRRHVLKDRETAYVY